MSTYLNNLFNFSRDLPDPYKLLRSKKVKASSKFSDGSTESTLCASVIKAVHAVCHCMDGTGEGAIGQLDHRNVAEYKSSMGDDSFHLVVYDQTTGSIMATVYDRNTEMSESYVASGSGRDGAALVMALMPTLLAEDEFKSQFDDYYDMFKAGFPDMTQATECMGILCDNAYRRVKDQGCSAPVKVEIDKSGNLIRVSQTHLDSGTFTPQTVLAGEFTIFAKTGPATIKKASTVIEHSDFVGKFKLQTRTLTPLEQRLVPALPEWYIIPQEVVDICKHAQATTGKPTQMRNFLLRGPAGTGKTMGAKAIAAGLGLPYMKYTCSAGTEIYDCATCS